MEQRHFLSFLRTSSPYSSTLYDNSKSQLVPDLNFLISIKNEFPLLLKHFSKEKFPLRRIASGIITIWNSLKESQKKQFLQKTDSFQGEEDDLKIEQDENFGGAEKMLQQLQIPHFLFDRLRKPETALAPLTSKPSSEQLLEKIIDIIIEDVESRTISLRAVRRRLEATFCYPLNDMKQEIKCLVEEATKIIDGGNGYLFD